MLISKKRFRRILSIVLAVLLLLVASGCGNPVRKGVENMVKDAISDAIEKGKDALAEGDKDDSGYEDDSDYEDDYNDEDDDYSYYNDSDDYGYGSPASKLYQEFVDKKSALAATIAEALGSQPELSLSVLSLLGITMIDLAALPASVLGYGQGTVQATLNFFIDGAVDYAENGNHYEVKYTNTEEEEIVFIADYDEAEEALIITVTEDGKDYIHYDYRRTPYGFAGQIYSVTDNKVTEMYQITIHENGGVLGISTDLSGKPGGLSGNVSVDFPKDSQQWYSIDGKLVTGVTGSGNKFEFEYTPQSE